MPHADLDERAIAQLRTLDAPGSNEIFKRLVESYVTDTPKTLAKLSEAIAACDWGAASRHAHAIKGSSGNFGVRRLAALCLQIEQAGKSGDGPTVIAAADHLAGEFESARAALVEMAGA